MIFSIEVSLGSSTCSLGLQSSPGAVEIGGDTDLGEVVRDTLARGYGVGGHVFDLGSATALDLVAAATEAFGDGTCKLIEGRKILDDEAEELAAIEKEGAS